MKKYGGWYALFGAPTPFDPTYKWVTSTFLSPMTLAVLRLTMAFYGLVTLVFAMSWDFGRLHESGSEFFAYFTELTYIGLTSYFWASGVQTLVYARGIKREGSAYVYPLQRWPRPLQFLHSLLFSTITTFPFVVTVVFWALLADAQTLGTPFGRWSNTSFHAMNSLFAIIEIVCSHGGPTPWVHMILLVVIAAGYLGVAYINYAHAHFYTYSFLDPATEGAHLAAYIVGIAVGICIVFAITRSACALREWIWRRHRGTVAPPRGASRVGSNTSEATQDWEIVQA